MRIRRLIFVFLGCLAILFASFSSAALFGGKKAQLALVVDFSKSGETTIQALTSNYWEIYNSFREKNPNVKLEMALIGYSKQSFGTKNNYVKVISTFQDEPDKAFEYLVSNPIGSSVSQNYVGQALDATLKQLSWDKNPLTNKQIITIGNGPIRDSYSLAKKVCAKAKKESIVVNSLYVLYKQNDKNHSYWMALTDMSGGKLKTIVPRYLIGNEFDYRTKNTDLKIVAENEILLDTYVPYGDKGIQRTESSQLIDQKCGEMGLRVLSSRVQFKCGPYFQGRNSNWDLVEKCVLRDAFGDELRALGVPSVLEKLSDVQLETALSSKWIERNGSVKIVESLTKVNLATLAKFPEKAPYKRDLGETILVLFNEGGV